MRFSLRRTDGEIAAPASVASGEEVRGFVQGLGLFDATMLVVGIMIGSGIFIVSADMARQIGSPGGLLLAWGITGLLTVAGALSYGELAAMMPWAGGQYVFLREAFSPLWGFLYGWTLFLVIQTGTIAAVSVAFARFLGVLWPAIAEDRYLIPPVHLSEGYALSLSTNQVVAIGVIALLTWANMRGVTYGKLIQNIFTVAKMGALLGLILVALLVGWNARAVAENFSDLWTPRGYVPLGRGLDVTTPLGVFVALCVAQTGSLFSADAWQNVTFAAAEVKSPRRTVPLAMGLGVLVVIALYLLANVAYLVTLPLEEIQRAPFDRVATAVLQAIFPSGGASLMATAIMVSTFGTVNGLILAGARAYYAMARDGLFFAFAGRLNEARVPGWALVVQGLWAAALVLPRTFHPETGTYGNLYSNLLDYVISAALLFYILTILGVFRLRTKWPDRERPYRVWGYPLVPALYIVGAGAILAVLLSYRTATTWPGFILVLAGIPVYGLLRSGRSRARPGTGVT
jgi:APA family basic amino acid/polyamine antiporter